MTNLLFQSPISYYCIQQKGALQVKLGWALPFCKDQDASLRCIFRDTSRQEYTQNRFYYACRYIKEEK